MTRAISTIHLTPSGAEADRTRIFQRMLAEGRAAIVQYHLPAPSLGEWLACTGPDRAWFGILSIRDAGDAEGLPAGAVWITDFSGKAALFHFVLFRGYGHLCRPFCRLACRWAFDGGLACLLGLIPSVNRAALAGMRVCGWRESLRIPQACYVHRLGRCVDGVLCHCTPKLLSEVV